MSALFQTMEAFCRQPQGKDRREIFLGLLLDRGDRLAAKLAAEGAPLWRWSGGVPFDETRWRETLSVGWQKRGSFPTLYKEPGVYDKREVVACLLLAAGITLSEADAMLDELSVRDQSYEVRRLYPLHFKEGFFRLVLAWNERHPDKFSFPQAVAAYQDYETALMEELRQKWRVLEKQIARQPGVSEDFRLAKRCHGSALELWGQAEDWAHPLRLSEQDELQRLIVLMAHEERALEEAENGTDGDIFKRNKNTRPAAQRGTRLCQDIIECCAKEEDWTAAASRFLRESLPAMGEAYWRAVSWAMKTYGESGGRGVSASPYVRQRTRSVRNAGAKTFRAVSVFSQDPARPSLSFSLDAAQVKELVRSGSANTVLIAELLRPVRRDGEDLFGQPDSDVPQTLLSLFLSGYQRWLEGKTGIQRQGERRVPMPFYEFKRRTVLKYALACGCRSRAKLYGCMEFAGYGGLSDGDPAERLVQEVLYFYETQAASVSPIPLLMDMQMYLLYFSAQRYLNKFGSVVDEEAVRRQVRALRKGLLYEPDLPELSTKGGELKKQDRVEAFLTLCFLAMLALEHISQQTAPFLKGGPALAEAVLAQWETGGEFWRDVPEGSLLFMDNPQDSAVRYVRYRSGDLVWKTGFSKPAAAPEAPFLSALFKLAAQQLALLTGPEMSASSTAKTLYESWFLIFSILVGSYGQGALDMLPEALAFLDTMQDRTVLWTFLGGARNFSVRFYEQNASLNHFTTKHFDVDRTQGSRWLRYLHDMREKLPVWEEILSDARTIHRCAQYFRERDLLPPQQLEAELERFREKLREICEILAQMEANLGATVEERNLRKKLAYFHRQLKIFL